jgi:hypothetical protein
VFPHHWRRLADLDSLKTALERYHQNMGSYPGSADAGTSWNGVGWKGAVEDWLPGLAPSFIPGLPADPRGSENPYNQYVYKSDGRDYKLLSLVPEDCDLIVRQRPSMSDPARNVYNQCYAVGFWTPGAAAW